MPVPMPAPGGGSHPGAPTEPTHATRSGFLEGDRLLLIREAAAFLRVSDKTVRRLIVEGKLPSGKVRGKRVVRLQALNALVNTAVPPLSHVDRPGEGATLRPQPVRGAAPVAMRAPHALGRRSTA